MSSVELTHGELRKHTTFCPNSDGTITAIYAHPDGSSAMQTGHDEEQALHFIQVQLSDKKNVARMKSRPWLTLCGECNRGSAEAQERGESQYAYCAPCSDAIDEWKKRFDEWQADVKRRARNKRKARARQ